MPKKLDIKTGEKYNRLTIINPNAGYHVTSGGNKLRKVTVKCECGTIKDVTLNSIRNGNTVSCGCYNQEKAGTNLVTHNYSKERLYRIWKDMKRRCKNKNRRNYHNYGGRGIKVCDEWDSDYLNFRDWSIKNGYSDELSIDRIDNDGNYEPNNCRWISQQLQLINTSKQKEFIAISPDGKEYRSKVIKTFAEEHNLHRGQVSDCLNGRQLSHRGWKFYRI